MGQRITSQRIGGILCLDVAAGVILYAGTLACLTAAGTSTPGAISPTIKGLGRVKDTVDNTLGQAGDLKVEIERGVFCWDNSADADEIAAADIGNVCYIIDDHTVAKTSNGNTRGKAGFVIDVDDEGVWVESDIAVLNALAGSFAVANNLSEGVAATIRGNIGANKIFVPLHIPDLKTALAYGVPAPRAGTISKVYSVLGGHALATGDATLTGKIAAAAIANGVVTITEAGSAIGDKDSATPSAANVVAAGDWINFTVGGTNDNTAAFADLLIEITY